MGSGKSTVGALVAQRTGRAFVDVDTVIADETGKTVRELWEEGGEAAYRYLESDVVLEVLPEPDADGAGRPGRRRASIPPCAPPSSTASSSGSGPSPATLAGRVRSGDHRPLLGDSPAETFAAMAEMRSGLYRQVADAVIDTDDRAPEAIADDRRRTPGRTARRTPANETTGDTMLRPQDTATRETKRLDGLWSFTADADGVGRAEGWWRGRPARGPAMPVPSSFNDVLVDPQLHDHVGDVWYQRPVFIPAVGPGSGSSSGSTRRPTAPRCGSATPVSSSTRAATPPSRRT